MSQQVNRCLTSDGVHKFKFYNQPFAQFSYGSGKQEYNFEAWKVIEKSVSTKLNFKILDKFEGGFKHSKSLKSDIGIYENFKGEGQFNGTISIPIMFCSQCGSNVKPSIEEVKECVEMLNESAEKNKLKETVFANKNQLC